MFVSGSDRIGRKIRKETKTIEKKKQIYNSGDSEGCLGSEKTRENYKKEKKISFFLYFCAFLMVKVQYLIPSCADVDDFSQIFLIFQISHPLGLLPHLLPQISQLTRCTV